ncbi:uncharacterized protein [Asterias amurensis]|uniref:uncharacterized protein n=1 Tax=Asterias amurensis TaxID=7602 RepID=UPI003AB6F808
MFINFTPRVFGTGLFSEGSVVRYKLRSSTLSLSTNDLGKMAVAIYCLTLLLMCIITGVRSNVSNQEVHKRDSETQISWQQIGGALKHVSIGQAGVWGVNSGDYIYYRVSTYGDEANRGSTWVNIGGRLKQIDVGQDVAWGVNSNDNIYYRAGISNASPTGTSWVQVAGALKHVSVSQKGHVWGVNSNDDIFHRIAASICYPEGSWKHISGKLKQISVGDAGVWGVNSGDSIYYRVGTFGDPASDPNGSTWEQVPGALKYVSSATGIFGVNAADVIYTREGISASNPTGSQWRSLPGRLKQIESLSSVVWGVNSGDNIYVTDSD